MFEKNEPTPITEEVIDDKKKKKEKKAKEPKPEKAKKDKKSKKEKKEKKGLSVISLIIPFVLSIGLIAGLYVMIGSKTESAVDTIPIMYASRNIEKNTYIKAEDYPNYFKVCETDVSLIPETAIQSAEILPEDGVYVRHAIVSNQMMLVSDLSDTDLVMGKYFENVYKTSIACTTFKSSVSGRVRHGDIINVFAKDPETKELVLLAKDVYVDSAYDANGAECTEPTQVAVSFNVWAASDEEVRGLNLAVTYGDIQIYVSEGE